MTLVELVIALPIVLVASMMLFGTISACAQLSEMNRQRALAAQRVRTVLEQMRNEDFEEIYRLYNADPWDDPMGPGTAFGNRFDVPPLQSLAGPGEPVGEVILPAVNVSTGAFPQWQLREDLTVEGLGPTRDLNGDSIVDGLDHSADYQILPVVVEARWQGRFGARRYRAFTLFTEYRR